MIDKLLDNPALFMAGLLLAMWLILSRLSPYYFTLDNLFEITIQAAVIALIAVGQTFVILSGGIDLSVGAVLAATSVVASIVMDHGYGLTAGIAAGLLCGAVFGAANGIAVGKDAPQEAVDFLKYATSLDVANRWGETNSGILPVTIGFARRICRRGCISRRGFTECRTSTIAG